MEYATFEALGYCYLLRKHYISLGSGASYFRVTRGWSTSCIQGVRCYQREIRERPLGKWFSVASCPVLVRTKHQCWMLLACYVTLMLFLTFFPQVFHAWQAYILKDQERQRLIDVVVTSRSFLKGCLMCSLFGLRARPSVAATASTGVGCVVGPVPSLWAAFTFDLWQKQWNIFFHLILLVLF